MSSNPLEKQIDLRELLMSRDQLMEKVESIVGDYFEYEITRCSDLGEIENFNYARDCLVKNLCDAVYKNFSVLITVSSN